MRTPGLHDPVLCEAVRGQMHTETHTHTHAYQNGRGSVRTGQVIGHNHMSSITLTLRRTKEEVEAKRKKESNRHPADQKLIDHLVSADK